MKTTTKIAILSALTLGAGLATVTAQEAGGPPAPGSRRHPAQSEPAGEANPLGRRPPAPIIVLVLNANRDGIIEASEIERVRAAIRSFDRNADVQAGPEGFFGPRRGPAGWAPEENADEAPAFGPRGDRGHEGALPPRGPGFGREGGPGPGAAERARPERYDDDGATLPAPRRLHRTAGESGHADRALPPRETKERPEGGPAAAPEGRHAAAADQGPADRPEGAALPRDREQHRGPGHPGANLTPSQLLEKYDINKDGKLDESELAALLNDLHQARAARRPMADAPERPEGQAPGPEQPADNK